MSGSLTPCHLSPKPRARVREQLPRGHLHRHLATASADHLAAGSDPVTEGKAAELIEIGRQLGDGEQLHRARPVPQLGEGELSVQAQPHESACDDDVDAGLVARLQVREGAGDITGSGGRLEAVTDFAHS